MRTWEMVTVELDSLAGEEAPPEYVTVEEGKLAYEAYRKDFSKRYRKLLERDL